MANLFSPLDGEVGGAERAQGRREKTLFGRHPSRDTDLSMSAVGATRAAVPVVRRGFILAWDRHWEEAASSLRATA